MNGIRNIGIVVILIGCAYAAFWLTALHEWQAGARYQQGQLTKQQFEDEFPILRLICRWWDFAPFDNKYEDRAIRPGVFVHRGIVRHSILGGVVVGAGCVAVVIGRIKKRRKSEPATAPYSEPASRSPQG